MTIIIKSSETLTSNHNHNHNQSNPEMIKQHTDMGCRSKQEFQPCHCYLGVDVHSLEEEVVHTGFPDGVPKSHPTCVPTPTPTPLQGKQLSQPAGQGGSKGGPLGKRFVRQLLQGLHYLDFRVGLLLGFMISHCSMFGVSHYLRSRISDPPGTVVSHRHQDCQQSNGRRRGQRGGKEGKAEDEKGGEGRAWRKGVAGVGEGLRVGWVWGG